MTKEEAAARLKKLEEIIHDLRNRIQAVLGQVEELKNELRGHAGEFPFTVKLGQKMVRFSAQGIQREIQKQSGRR